MQDKMSLFLIHEKQLLDMWNDAKNFKQLNKLEPLR